MPGPVSPGDDAVADGVVYAAGEADLLESARYYTPRIQDLGNGRTRIVLASAACRNPLSPRDGELWQGDLGEASGVQSLDAGGFDEGPDQGAVALVPGVDVDAV